MTSFALKIKDKMESQAYCMGVNAFQAGYHVVESPFDKDSKADKEWLDGFHDAWYMRIITGGSHEPRD